ncbi:hypothetical protein C8R43DRAFT_908992, partial [Mycena crocata]
SSLTLSLPRCIFTDGTVLYDNIPTSSVNLDALPWKMRFNLVLQPELLVSNMDIFTLIHRMTAPLNSALHAAGLSSLQQDMDEGSLTLDSEVSSAVGQRQIIPLARAIVRGSKLLRYHLAQSESDYKTDSGIQASLRNELPKDATVRIVAHRLASIMDANKIAHRSFVGFDSPAALLKNKHGMFRALMDEFAEKTV